MKDQDERMYEYEGKVYRLKDSFVSPLGHLMIKLQDPQTNSSVNFNLGPFENLLKKLNQK